MYTLFDLIYDVCLYFTLIYLHYIAKLTVKAKRVTEYESIIRELGFNVRVYLLDLDVPNAVVLGFIPRTEYILVLGRLEKWFTRDEIKAILAHELGHIRDHPYTWPLIAAITLSFIKVFLPEDLLNNLTILTVLIVLAMCAYMLLVTPLICRFFEKKADIFAAKLVGKELYIQTLKKVHKLLGYVEKQPKIVQIFTTHPDLQTRIKIVDKHA